MSISLTSFGTAYTQNFNSLATVVTSSAVPADWAFLETGTNADTEYTAGNGSLNTGDTYSFGAPGATDRAFGGIQSTNLIPTIGAFFINDTGALIASLDISYFGEQWRLGNPGRTDKLDFQYSYNATGLATGIWADADTLDFSTPNTAGIAAATDGNDPQYRTAVSATLTGVNIASGATFAIRWTDFNASGADDGLAIDDFSLKAFGVSETGPPAFSGLDANPTFNENGVSVLLDQTVSISDPDITGSTPFAGATLRLARSTGANPDDTFNAACFADGQVYVTGQIPDPDNPNNTITVDIPIGTYVADGGTLFVTFNENATTVRINQILPQLTYVNVGEAPPSSVTIAYTFDNGQVATGSITININAQNDIPLIDALAASSTYSPGTTGGPLSPGVLISDIDSPTLNRATVTFVGSLGTDALSADVGSTGITAGYAGGVLTLSGDATIEQYRQVLQTVAYTSSAADPTNDGADPTRTLRWQIRDSSNASSTTADLLVKFAPTVDLDQSGAGTGFAATFTEGGAAVHIGDSDVNIREGSDPVSAVMVVLTNAKAGDSLTAPGVAGPITVSIDDSVPGRITLTLLNDGFAAESHFEAALEQVVFSNANENPDTTTRIVTVSVAGADASNLAQTTITVVGVNDPGSATNDTASTAEDTVLNVAAAQGVLANDNDPDGLSVVTGAVATANGGAITFQSDGSYSYTPPANFSGVDTVDYTAQDPFGDQVSATLSITVTAVNDPPVVSGAVTLAAIAEDSGARLITQAELTGNASDIDGPPPLTAINLAKTSGNGTLVNNNNGTWSYTPALNDDTGVSFSYQVTDGTTPVTASATLDITPLNDAPVVNGAVTLTAITEDSGARLITQAQLLGNASDVDGPLPLTAISLAKTSGNGTLVNNNNGTWSYTPALNDDTGASFSYQVTDGVAAPVADSATLDITPVNDAPVVNGAVTLAAIAEDSGARLITQAELTGNASDVDGPSLAAVNLAIATGGGTLVNNNNGTWSYTPALDDDTGVSFSYQVTDGVAAPVADSATLDITPVSDTTVLSGTPGDDSFTALSGDERIDGGGGIDTVTFGFRLVDATVTYSGNQVIIDSASSHTVLTGFERYVFTDGTVNNNDGSWLIDDLYYYSQYHDVWNAHVDADAHYNSNGWHEFRNPNAFFDTGVYLSIYQDVKASGANPLTQFDTSGWMNHRIPSLNFDPDRYLKDNPDIAAAHVDPLEHFLRNGAAEGRQPTAPTELIATNGFDYVYYLQHNPDVRAAHVDPFEHFQSHGWLEGRNPNALFDVNGYLGHYPDVAAAHINPLDHYHAYGWTEGRDPSVGFDTTSYLAAYPDVAAAHIDPLKHFLQNGIHEGRSPFADGVWG